MKLLNNFCFLQFNLRPFIFEQGVKKTNSLASCCLAQFPFSLFYFMGRPRDGIAFIGLPLYVSRLHQCWLFQRPFSLKGRQRFSSVPVGHSLGKCSGPVGLISVADCIGQTGRQISVLAPSTIIGYFSKNLKIQNYMTFYIFAQVVQNPKI